MRIDERRRNEPTTGKQYDHSKYFEEAYTDPELLEFYRYTAFFDLEELEILEDD